MSLRDTDKIGKCSLGWMPFYFERFSWSVRGWNNEAAYAYLMLLCEQWNAGSIDSNPDVLENIAKGTKKHWKVISSKFQLGDDNRLRNHVCHNLRQTALETSERRINAAKTASNARWKSDTNALPMRDASETHCNENESDIENKNENQNIVLYTLDGQAAEPNFAPIVLKRNVSSLQIEMIWDLFPRKVGKLQALKSIDKALKTIQSEFDLETPQEATEFLMEKIRELAKSSEGVESQFIPHPATWLNQRRWDDEIKKQVIKYGID